MECLCFIMRTSTQILRALLQMSVLYYRAVRPKAGEAKEDGLTLQRERELK